MDRSIAQALSGLVPTLNELPAELLELAVSLLAQSRSRASSLKAEEEIARSYACANLACERYAYNLNQNNWYLVDIVLGSSKAWGFLRFSLVHHAPLESIRSSTDTLILRC